MPSAPTTFSLPSGLRVSLTAHRSREGDAEARTRARGAPLFEEVFDLFASGEVSMRAKGGGAIAVADLELRDFHTLRAIATKLGWLHEDRITFPCRNCERSIEHAPCAAIELGRFADGELDDAELDRTLPTGEPHAVPGLGEVVFGRVTAGEARPLFRALRRRRLVISAGFAHGMGLARLGDLTDAARIAKRLERASDDAFARLGDLFLETHYPPRLFSIAVCPDCGARNDVDAPYERELEPSAGARAHASGGEGAFPSFDDFDARANAIARELFEGEDPRLVLIVDGEVPACDDGGEPLLGAYVPPYEGDMMTPSRPPEITVYFRTFQAMWNEDGPYDWDAELRETIEHELEHHEGHLRGHDPMDEDERRAIDDEAARVVGRKAALTGGVSALGSDLAGFLRRTWPLWLFLLALTLILAIFDR